MYGKITDEFIVDTLRHYEEQRNIMIKYRKYVIV